MMETIAEKDEKTGFLRNLSVLRNKQFASCEYIIIVIFDVLRMN